MKQTQKLNWRTASEKFCARDDPMCVAVAEMSDGKIAIKNTQFRDATVHTREEFGAFVRACADGEFNDLI